ncbi:MAG: hypothetical protein GC206_12885 [Alphaproteobacteria bacterium]|nr:hypothetical protein [Alphaproteobacteria bacterium]
MMSRFVALLALPLCACATPGYDRPHVVGERPVGLNAANQALENLMFAGASAPTPIWSGRVLHPTDDQRAQMQAGALTMVLLRVTLEDQASGATLTDWARGPRVHIGVGNLDTGGEIAPLRLSTAHLSLGSRDAGWVYFLTPPGTFYLSIALPDRPMDEQPDTIWRLDPPSGATIVYAGTLALNAVLEPTRSNRRLRIQSLAGANVRDEREAAAQLAPWDGLGLGGVETSLLTPHQGVLFFNTPQAPSQEFR